MKKIGFLFLTLVIFIATIEVEAQNAKTRPLNYISDFIKDYISIKYPMVDLGTFIYVGVERQKMFLFIDGEVEKIYDVSTSKNGAGTQSGSEQTPIGLHIIDGKFGEGLPKGSVLRGKKFTGKIADIQTEPISTGSDDITSRVITIKGLEVGINKGGQNDSYNRKIYIHGTVEEGFIGQPASHGCVRMRNDDVIELFDIIDEGVKLIILNN
jgi:lipoprotein-anchoring transpeptidase ErfK/SrfK